MPSLKQIAAPVGALLRERRQTVRFQNRLPELISAALLAVPGASAYLLVEVRSIRKLLDAASYVSMVKRK